jgi:calcineurin-like phosphoesterase family protein
MRRPRIPSVILLTACCTTTAPLNPRGTADAQGNESAVRLPNKAGSFRFAVLGDAGTGEKAQYELADQMAALHDRFKYHTVLLLGGNLHGSERPQDVRSRFEVPYKRLLDQGVKFYASLGNEDAREQRFYKPFNMAGNLYYTFSPRPGIQFFALESTYMDPDQIAWLETELKGSRNDWKIAFFHHPIYSSGRRHGSDAALRRVLEPPFQRYNVSVVFSARDNIYERIKTQKDIAYFVAGSGGMLSPGGIDPASGLTASGFDTDLAFMAAEIIGDQMYFNVIARGGQTVDSGVVPRNKAMPERLRPN